MESRLLMSQATDTTKQAFIVSDNPTFTLESIPGRVVITPGANNEIHVAATRRIGHHFSVTHESLDHISVNMTQADNNVHIVGKCDHSIIKENAQIDYDITLPTMATLAIRLPAGKINITGITGAFQVRLAAGDILLDNTSGTHALTLNAGKLSLENVTIAQDNTISVDAGDIRGNLFVQNAANLNLHIATGNIDLALPTTWAAHLDAHVDIGKIDLSGWSLRAARQGFGPSMSASGDLGTPSNGNTIVAKVAAGRIALHAA
jgi:DUF4097 and DUF4098 domain-containing protein YvlB